MNYTGPISVEALKKAKTDAAEEARLLMNAKPKSPLNAELRLGVLLTLKLPAKLPKLKLKPLVKLKLPDS